MQKLIVAIDPGDRHVGVALGWSGSRSGCIEAYETTPKKIIEIVSALMETTKNPSDKMELVIEEYKLYPWLATSQSFSDFPTSQLIGVLKHVAGQKNVQVIMQSATVKKPAESVRKGRKILWKSASRHAKDAQLHLLYRQER